MSTDSTERIAEIVSAGRAMVDEELRSSFADFAKQLLSSGRSLTGSDAGAVARLVVEAFEFCSRREEEEIKLALLPASGASSGSVLLVLQRDRPFLTDTVRLALRRHELRWRAMLHPVLSIERDSSGELVSFTGPAKESLNVVELQTSIASDAAGYEIEAALRSALSLVQDVTADHQRMLSVVRELSANVGLAAGSIPGGEERCAKIQRFLDWIVDQRFLFVGLRRYTLANEGGELEIALRPDSGLGYWRRHDTESLFLEPKRGLQVPKAFADLMRDPPLIQVEKSRIESTIHRNGRLDRILITEYDESGRPCGFTILFGLFTFRALRTPGSQVPLLAERLDWILESDGAAPGSHRHKAIVAAFDAAPVEFLLGSDTEGVRALIGELADRDSNEEAHLVLRADRSGRSFYAAVLMPRELYRESLRMQIGELLRKRTGVAYTDERASFFEDDTAALHFFCTSSADALELPPLEVLEQEIQILCARWEDLFADALRESGVKGWARLADSYGRAFPDGLRLLTRPSDAVRDVEALERLHASGEPQVSLYFDASEGSLSGEEAGEHTTLKLYLPEAVLLSDLLPIVDKFGIRVVDAQQSEMRVGERAPCFVNTLRILPLGDRQADLDGISKKLSEALCAAIMGRVASDELASLVLLAGLDWREVDCIRAYLDYFAQIQGQLTRPFVRSVLLENPLIVRRIVEYHEARLAESPDLEAADKRADELEGIIASYREGISSLNEDRAIGALIALINATLRTNFFAERAKPHRIAFKVDPTGLPEVDDPRPYREIFVHSVDLMGIHLRGGEVARGGLRWSDRLSDLRTEILGLMRTQTLKNGIIVPVGAKGGFVLERQSAEPSVARAQADAQYRIFIASLLEITDNVAEDGRVVPPAGVRRRDGDDPYLVVAADKGTAHLSDTANEVAESRGFWLGDAFASGGSEGYDHKKYGITARGAWECVLHHFAELGLDPTKDDYSVAGIGDMSGDVFGNGLLLARRARLRAAFDHRHIFLDPDPDPERSWQERRRLFELPRSNWGDYDETLISSGGGVFPRAAKRIRLTPPLQEMLALESSQATGDEVVRAILSMRVDLLWNGGIGTYVKAAAETHEEVGDRNSDSVRIDAGELRARVVGEGGNLGLTQRARVEASRAGVRLDSDAVHNSAGVDLSDHEVNFKILMAPTLRSGRLSRAERTALLFEVADEACEQVLDHNRGQALSISLDERRSRQDLDLFRSALAHLCAAQGIEGEAVGLPSDRDLERRASSGGGLTRPELSVLLGLAKLDTRRSLAASAAIDSASLGRYYASYFPERLRERFAEEMKSHRLRREITALIMTNRLLDAGGVTIIPTFVSDLGIGVVESAYLLLAAEEILRVPYFHRRLIEGKQGVPREATYAALLEFDLAVRRVARLIFREGYDPLDPVWLSTWQDGLFVLREKLASFLTEQESLITSSRREEFQRAGLPRELATDIATLPLADRGLNIVCASQHTGAPLLDTARVYAHLGESTGINTGYQRLAHIRPEDEWDRMILIDLRGRLLGLQRALTQFVLTRATGDPLRETNEFLSARASDLARIRDLGARSEAHLQVNVMSVYVQALEQLRLD